jgi:hypothetical protein
MFNDWIPVDHFLRILTLLTLAAVAFGVYRAFKWMLGMLRGAGTT